MQPYQTFGVFAAVALVPTGFLIAFVMGWWIKLRPGGIRRTKAQAVGLLLVGIGFICFATSDLYAIYASAKITVEGQIEFLRQTHGKGHTSYFYIYRLDQQESPQLSTGYSGNRLKNGEPVRVTYLSNTTTVTDLRVLAGPNADWSLKEGNGIGTSVAMICIAGLMVFAGFAVWVQKPSNGGDDRSSNGGGDATSVLHLDVK